MNLKTGTYISIPTILGIEPGIIDRMGIILKKNGINSIVLFFGNDLIGLFGQRILKSLSEAGVEVISYCELDDADAGHIAKIAYSIPNHAGAVAGIGGGKVIDAAKYMGFLRQLPFISVPTSSSSDGFSSASASLYVDGRKSTLPAAMAFGILVDTEVIKTAPVRFLYSGIGDMVSKITALYDWIYEEEAGVSKINDMAVMIAKKAVNSFVRTPFNDIHEDVFIKELLNSLAMSGIANEIAGGSAPTSGSEHLISHALDKYAEKPQLHGIQVGIATLLMAKLQEHRYRRVHQLLFETGFWDYCCSLGLSKADYVNAINMAPAMKPHRYTYIHNEEYRKKALEILDTDPDFIRLFNA